MQATFTAKAVPNTFYPFTNTVSGNAEFTWNFNDTTTETFSADGTEYNYLAMGYVFAPTTATNISAELTLTDGNNSKTVEFPKVEIEANQRSNKPTSNQSTNRDSKPELGTNFSLHTHQSSAPREVTLLS